MLGLKEEHSNSLNFELLSPLNLHVCAGNRWLSGAKGKTSWLAIEMLFQVSLTVWYPVPGSKFNYLWKCTDNKETSLSQLLWLKNILPNVPHIVLYLYPELGTSWSNWLVFPSLTSVILHSTVLCILYHLENTSNFSAISNDFKASRFSLLM